MKHRLFSLRAMGVMGIVVLFLLELAVARHLFFARSSKDDDSGPTENGLSQGTIAADASQAGSVPGLDVPEDMDDANTDAERLEELPAPWTIYIGDYTVKTELVITNDEPFTELEVWKGQVLLYQTAGWQFDLASDRGSEDDATHSYFEPGVNVTGNGIPNLIVTEYSGGAHCCLTYYIFELGNEFRLIDTIPAEDGEIEFKDVDGNGIPEIIMPDWSYAYVFGCFASSPAPDVILRYTTGHYEIAPDLMQSPAPDAEELQQMADEIKTNYAQMVENGEVTYEWAADSGLWQHMLDLIYGGHEDEARRLYDMAWPGGMEDEDEALTNFVAAVSDSLFWRAVYGGEGKRVKQPTDY